MGTAENIPFGPVIKDKRHVEERIRRAQRAILCPSRNPELFLSGPDEDAERRDITFSKNCVSLEISGPELTDLSFCDLPGALLPPLLLSVRLNRIEKDSSLVSALAETLPTSIWSRIWSPHTSVNQVA